MKVIIKVSISIIGLDRFDHVIVMNFHQGFNFLEFIECSIFGLGGIYLKKSEEIINESWEILTPPSGGVVIGI